MNDNRIPLTYTKQRSTERLNAELARQRSRNARKAVDMWMETYHPPTATKAAMLENAVPLAPADEPLAPAAEPLDRWEIVVIFVSAFFTFLVLVGISVSWLFWMI